MKNEYTGNIMMVRAVEDTIRATGKYTEGVFTRRARHPIQGEEFPSKVLSKHYEVYPDLDLDKTMPFWDALRTTGDWLWGDTPHVDIKFHYNYPRNRAMVTIYGGDGVIGLLVDGIPGFNDALSQVRNGEGA